MGLTLKFFKQRLTIDQDMIGLREIASLQKNSLRNPKSHWVYDIEHDVLCVVQMGDHIGAVRFLAKEFYGLTRIKQEEISKWQEIIADNMIFQNAAVDDTEHYALHLPQMNKE